jgi:hypothetical protein
MKAILFECRSADHADDDTGASRSVALISRLMVRIRDPTVTSSIAPHFLQSAQSHLTDPSRKRQMEITDIQKVVAVREN